MARLIDKIEDHEKKVAEELAKERKKPVVIKLTDPLGKSASGKNKQISAKVNAETYELFTHINRINGMSNNSSLNLLITNYVRENKFILEED